ncbi:hypothetical protein PVK06_021095 [Gossypium arboreum]|uniref:Uncharacterized protein n=1 Tax=Gossypium arboreum TaxID=29729 RepID=A0ABR0PPK8_GOSAR|nr:hypothetical protein PVK06_021095 [Gossypium arboreum]
MQMEERRGNIKAENEMTINMKEEQSTLDWRGRPSNPNKHGGFQAASFVLGLQAFEIMAIAAVGNNLITYVINEMHFSLSNSANIVTNFVEQSSFCPSLVVTSLTLFLGVSGPC